MSKGDFFKMAINVFYNIEHYTMPQIFYCGKTNFFMGAAYNKGFLHQTFNSFFEMAFQKGVIKKKRKFKAGDFKISEKIMMINISYYLFICLSPKLVTTLTYI